MKITNTEPTGDPVRSINGGASTVRRAVKIALKNLKRWCVRLRQGATVHLENVGFKGNQQNRPDEIEVSCAGRTTPIMVVDQEESRNRTNENLENELRESLANKNQSETSGVIRSNESIRLSDDLMA